MAQIETCENHKDEGLQTRYFKASYEDVKNAYRAYLQGKYKLISVNDVYGELFSEGQGVTVTAKIIQYAPKETAVDFYVVCDSILGASKAKAYCKDSWDAIGKRVELIGVALHK